jgi:hypothetical protein
VYENWSARNEKRKYKELIEKNKERIKPKRGKNERLRLRFTTFSL